MKKAIRRSLTTSGILSFIFILYVSILHPSQVAAFPVDFTVTGTYSGGAGPAHGGYCTVDAAFTGTISFDLDLSLEPGPEAFLIYRDSNLTVSEGRYEEGHEEELFDPVTQTFYYEWVVDIDEDMTGLRVGFSSVDIAYYQGGWELYDFSMKLRCPTPGSCLYYMEYVFESMSENISPPEILRNGTGELHVDFYPLISGPRDLYEASLDGVQIAPPPPAQTILPSPLPVYKRSDAMPNSCAVVSAAMVMGYWDNHGFPEIISGDSDSQNSDVNAAIDQLASDMLYIPDVGTLAVFDGPGMHAFFDRQEGYTSSYYYSPIASEHYSAGVMTFDLLTGVIDSGLPFLLYTRIRTSPWQIILPGHAIFVYGYQDNPGDDDDWVAVYDTWGLPSLSNNYSSVPAKIEDGIEWWRWTPIDTSGPDFHMWEALVFLPFHGGNSATYNRRDSFSSQENFDELYITVSGAAVVTESPVESGESVLQLSSPDSTPALMYTYVCGAPTLGISFEYLFDTSGNLRIYLDDVLLDAILAPENGPGAPGSDMMMTYSQWFNLADYGLDTEGSFELRFELTDPVDPLVYLDDVTILYTTPIPEPGTLLLFAPALLGVAGIALRRRK